jgi:hypothetical protein
MKRGKKLDYTLRADTKQMGNCSGGSDDVIDKVVMKVVEQV